MNEIKLWTPLLKTSSPGVGNASSGGTPASVGHSYAFGNTEEKARRLNMGCKARGQPGQPFDHKNGHGYVISSAARTIDSSASSFLPQ